MKNMIKEIISSLETDTKVIGIEWIIVLALTIFTGINRPSHTYYWVLFSFIMLTIIFAISIIRDRDHIDASDIYDDEETEDD